jgi:Flp pilus assembly pilin Flp
MLKFLVIAQNKFAELRDNESGNAAEYGLIIGLVAVGIIVALAALAAALTGTFTHVVNNLPKP